eukprot:Opistho-2@53084
MSANVRLPASHLYPYVAPEWARHLKCIPSRRLKICQTPTPIREWRLPNVPPEFCLHIKRDDLTGSATGGNKIRKLEFLLADAVAQNAKHIITCGGVQSNHCRATVAAASELGLESHLFLRSKQPDAEPGFDGNLLIDRMLGARLHVVPPQPFKTGLLPQMEALAAKLHLQSGAPAYLIPVGGSNATGFWGYVEAFRELMEQGLTDSFDDIVMACGSGGTACGIAVANALSGAKVAVHAITVCDSQEYFHGHVNETLAELGLGHQFRSEDILDVVDGYKGKGYALSTDAELAFIVNCARSTGILLDPVYTGKAAFGMVSIMNSDPRRFKGKRVLFIHTGGLFGLYDRRIEPHILSPSAILTDP